MKLILLISLILWGLIGGYAQTFSGRIIDLQKRPIEGAYIQQKSNGSHTHSNKDGSFSFIQKNTTDTLIISHIAYNTLVVPTYSKNEFLTIRMKQKILSLEEVKISPTINSLNVLTQIDLESDPVNSSQEILRKVPGLVIGQHAGGGKAEQIFLRGFDIDHGTDINITVDNMPVNMVSHAHGQGYADLHFLIPETIDQIDFGKGTYYANKGNFNTAGYVAFKTKDILDFNKFKIDVGSFNTVRSMGMLNLLDNENQSAYIASEYLLSDGPFESSQNFNRLNLMGKYTHYFTNRDKFSILFSHFKSEWDASGQIPQRAVENGLISRFGAIDDTEGGNTGRNNLLLSYIKHIDKETWVNSSIFISNYNFKLYSNFTFFLNDPINGDQIRQKEQRTLTGIQSVWNKTFNYGMLQAAYGYRNDIISDNELSHTLNRQTTIETIKLGNINETNAFSYINAEFIFGKWLINPALRYDWFKYIYSNLLSSKYSNEAITTGIVSPKLNIIYNHSSDLQLYLKSGKGFHSNDTRVVIEENGNKILPAAWGNDAGLILKPNAKVLLNASLWQLFLQQEFVYVGDEGVVEPGGRTQRAGIDFGLRLQLGKSIYINNDVNYTYARSIDDLDGENYIPLAPDLTLMGGLSYLPRSRFYANINYRIIKNRPANEDQTIIAKGYTIIDTNLGYKWNNMEIELIIENLFNSEWDETQFATESRLFNEVSPVEEIHFIPGTPFSAKISLSYIF